MVTGNLETEIEDLICEIETLNLRTELIETDGALGCAAEDLETDLIFEQRDDLEVDIDTNNNVDFFDLALKGSDLSDPIDNEELANPLKELTEAVIRHLTELGCRKSDIANLMGADAGTLSKIIRGERSLRMIHLMNIVERLETSLPMFLLDVLPDDSEDADLMSMKDMFRASEKYRQYFRNLKSHANPDRRRRNNPHCLEVTN